MEGLPILLGLGVIFAVAGALALFSKHKVRQIQEEGLRTEGFVWNLVKEQTNEWRYTIRFIGQDNNIHQASWNGTGTARLDDIVEIQYFPLHITPSSLALVAEV